jgi:hypothetical protein
VALLRLHEAFVREMRSYGLFFELVPHLLRDPSLRPRLRRLFEWYRRLDVVALGSLADPESLSRLEPLSLLTTSIADGIALQLQADPDLDISAAFDLWRTIVSDQLARLRLAPSE